MQRKEVEYALRAIPLGGFVAFPDDDPKLAEKYPKDDPNLLKNRPIKDRALVISAGIIANCIFAFSILCAQVCFASGTTKLARICGSEWQEAWHDLTSIVVLNVVRTSLALPMFAHL